jgi:hypothetical protein
MASNEGNRRFGVLDGDPATWIAGVEGKLYVDGVWKVVDSMEFVDAATIMSEAAFQRAYPAAHQALLKATRSEG